MEDAQEALSLDSAEDATPDAPELCSSPAEPRFFSASSVASKKFMQDVWNASQAGSHLFILEPNGGDAALAVKDLSAWRGNLDKPVQTLAFEDFVGGDANQVKELLAHEEMSDVIAVRLSSSDQLAQAKDHLEQVLQVVGGADTVFYVYLLEASLSVQAFEGMTESAGCVLPELCERPADVAQYARRFARLVADRSAKPKAAMFSPEAVYAVLAFEWPGNYQQVQEVVFAAVTQSENVPIEVDVLKDVLGEVVVPAPGARMEAFMRQVQARQLSVLVASGGSVEALAQRLEMSSNPQTEDDLRNAPLVNPRLANL